MVGGSSLIWMSFAALVESVRRFRNDGRVAETTIRAVPDRSSGTLCLPMGRVMVTRSGAAGDVVAALACSGESSAKSGIDFPFCSTATVSAENRAPGASADTRRVPAWPITRSGCSMRTMGTVSRRDMVKTTPAAMSSRTISPASARIMRTIEPQDGPVRRCRAPACSLTLGIASAKMKGPAGFP